MVSKTLVYNPLNEDVVCKYDANKDRNPIEFKIRAKETASFSEEIANHVRKNVVQRLMDVRGNYSKRVDTQMEEFIKLTQIEV